MRVEARSETRGIALGSKTVSFINVGYLNHERGVVAPIVLPKAVRRDGDYYFMPVAIRNPEPGNLAITNFTAGLMPCVKRDQAQQDPARYLPISAYSVLGTTTLPPGESHLELRFPSDRISDDICQVYFWGSGEGPEGLTLDLQISMMVMPPKAIPLDTNDPEQAKYFEKIRRAAALLGRAGGRISHDDILRLEQQGKL